MSGWSYPDVGCGCVCVYLSQEKAMLCMDFFRTVNRRVEELVSQVAGPRFYR